jgi:hypothetical protein
MAGVEEEKTSPTDPKKSNGDRGNGGGRKEKKTVGFREDGNHGKKKGVPHGKNSGRAGADEATKMVYAAKRATVEETKEQDTATAAANNTGVAAEEQKSSKTNNEGTAKPQQHNGGERKSSGGGGNRTTLSSNAAERRRDMVGGREERKRSQRGPTKVLQQCDEFTIVNYNVRGINTEEKQKKLYEILARYRPQIVCLNETKL